jgi:hypothetical protein
LGPPEKLEDFKGPQFPYQRWTYLNIQDIGEIIEIEFVDASMTGVYKIVPWSPVGDDKTSIADR